MRATSSVRTPTPTPDRTRRRRLQVIASSVILAAVIVTVILVTQASGTSTTPQAAAAPLVAPHGKAAYCAAVKRVNAANAVTTKSPTSTNGESTASAIAATAPFAPTPIAADLKLVAAWSARDWSSATAAKKVPSAAVQKRLTSALAKVTTYTNATCHVVFGVG